MSGPQATDAGETLIEIVISLVILGVAVLALLGAVGTGSILSAGHQDDARADLELKQVVEKIKSSAYRPGDAATGYAAAVGASASTTTQTARCWLGLPGDALQPTSWPSCEGMPAASDGGLQLLTVTVSSGGRSETLDVLKRKL